MRTLVIETATNPGAFALLGEPSIALTHRLKPLERSAELLIPQVRDAMDQVDWRESDVELFVVAHGPGSFTGLRVGLTMAKMFGYLTGCPLVAIDTMSAIAASAPERSGRLWIVLDAQRRGLYAAEYRAADHVAGPDLQDGIEVVSVEAFLGKLTPTDAVCGNGLRCLNGQLPVGVQALAPDHWIPDPLAMGRLGQLRAKAGRVTDPFRLQPLYLTDSAASEGKVAVIDSRLSFRERTFFRGTKGD